MSNKNRNIIIITIIVTFFSIILMIILNFTNKGFNLATYATENLLADQIEEILSEEGSEITVTEVYKGIMENEYLGIFTVDNSQNGECVIVDYEEVGNLGENKILELTRVVKGENGLVIMGIGADYKIFSSIAEDEYTGFNILNENNELIDEIILEELDENAVTKLDDESFILGYNNSELSKEIKVELIKRSE